MAKLVWDQIEDRDYESGLDRGVFYPLGGPGQAWNGLISVDESPSDVDARPRYMDGQKLGNRGRVGEFSATVEAFTYPDDFDDTPQRSHQRKHFGLSYRVPTNGGYKIHLVYNALVKPNENSYKYEDASTFKWELTTRGMRIPNAETVVSHLVIDTKEAYSWTVDAIEAILYGSEASEPRMPTPLEILDLFEENSILRIIDNGDGTWTAIGPDDVITMLDSTTFQINYSTAVYVDANTYTIHSL